jgi:hypothetical protein
MLVADRQRASDQDREAAAVALREHYAVGRLSTETLDQRVADVYAAKTRAELGTVMFDLPPIQPLKPRLRERMADAFDPRRRRPVEALSPPSYLPRGKRLLIGRSHGCDIVLADASVSRCHADLRRDGSQWILRDLHSTNGIAVNGRMVLEARLAPGDQISLGRTRLEWSPDDAQTFVTS